MLEYDATAETTDELFQERLDAFMHRALADIRAFADREHRDYNQTRRAVAEWHAKYLFQPEAPTASSQVRTVLKTTSHILESLSESSGVQSFFLAVDPHNPLDAGFLGGTVVGREFWRGLRGGSESGARAFRNHCAHLHPLKHTQENVAPLVPKSGPARSIKQELNETARNQLRLASGVRGAEMKWTNPERLDVYGVRLVGWPQGIPAQNPSSLKVSQNKALLEALQSGTMRFEKLFPEAEGSGEGANNNAEDFSWAYDVDAQPLSSVVPDRVSEVSQPWPPDRDDAAFAELVVDYSDDDDNERPRKRPREP